MVCELTSFLTRNNCELKTKKLMRLAEFSRNQYYLGLPTPNLLLMVEHKWSQIKLINNVITCPKPGHKPQS